SGAGHGRERRNDARATPADAGAGLQPLHAAIPRAAGPARSVAGQTPPAAGFALRSGSARTDPSPPDEDSSFRQKYRRQRQATRSNGYSSIAGHKRRRYSQA